MDTIQRSRRHSAEGYDRKILAIYQVNITCAAASIGEQVGLSAAAVQRRLKRLRETGVIRCEIAVLNPISVGAHITCVVCVSMAAKAAPRATLDKFKRDMISLPEVQQCYHVTGSLDFILIVAVAEMADYAAFARRWFESNSAIARFDTHVVLDAVKVGLAVPVGVGTI